MSLFVNFTQNGEYRQRHVTNGKASRLVAAHEQRLGTAALNGAAAVTAVRLASRWGRLTVPGTEIDSCPSALLDLSLIRWAGHQ